MYSSILSPRFFPSFPPPSAIPLAFTLSPMASAAPQRVPLEKVQGAVEALLKWRDSNSQSQKPKLFDQDEEFVYLVLTLKKIPPKGRTNPYKVPLPHALASPFSETCLIIDDRPNSNLTKDDAQKKIKAENVAVSKVLKLSKLASDYRPFEAKRKLCDSYDMFFVDRGVATLLPRLLGKKFFKKKKVPVQVDLRKRNWKEQVERACSSALFFVGTGTCSVVKVARVSMERDEIVDNVVAAIDGVIDVVPKKWGNVRSLHVKLLESLALPVYQAVPDVRLRIEGGKGEKENVVVEEKEKEEEEVSGASAKEAMKKKKKKKGRIHEVRYMDSEVGKDQVEDEDNDDGGVVVEEDSEDDEKVSGELANKKRKKGVKKEKGDFGELSGVKGLKKSSKEKSKEGGKQKKERVSAKVMKENSDKQSKNSGFSVEDGESRKKSKKKNGLPQSVGADMKKKVNAQRSKKAA